MYAGGGGDSIAVRFGGGEVDRSNRSVFLDEDRVLVLPPIPGLSIVLCRRRARVFADDYGLIVHDPEIRRNLTSLHTADRRGRGRGARGQKKFRKGKCSFGAEERHVTVR